MIDSISAVTLATHDMRRAVEFYRMLGFELLYGGDEAAFTSFRAGRCFLNLILQPAECLWSWWGRVIFYEPEVDALYARLVAAGCRPSTAPRDAGWGERFFHLTGSRRARAELCVAVTAKERVNDRPQLHPILTSRVKGFHRVDLKVVCRACPPHPCAQPYPTPSRARW